jgi:hypothetical protein
MINDHIDKYNTLVPLQEKYRNLLKIEPSILKKKVRELTELSDACYKYKEPKQIVDMLQNYIYGISHLTSVTDNAFVIEPKIIVKLPHTLPESITQKLNVSIEDIEGRLHAFLSYEANNDRFVTFIGRYKADILSIFNRYIKEIEELDESKRKVLGLLLKYEHILKGKTGGNTEPIKTAKKQILGKERCIYKKTGDRKEYVKHKGNLITVKDYRTLMKKKVSSTI